MGSFTNRLAGLLFYYLLVFQPDKNIMIYQESHLQDQEKKIHIPIKLLDPETVSQDLSFFLKFTILVKGVSMIAFGHQHCQRAAEADGNITNKYWKNIYKYNYISI